MEHARIATSLSAFSSFATAFRRGLAKRAATIVARMQIQRSLGKLSARQLRDIGLTHHDVHCASLGFNTPGTSEELAQRASQRIGNW